MKLSFASLQGGAQIGANQGEVFGVQIGVGSGIEQHVDPRWHLLFNAIKAGYRGAFWDILRRLAEGLP